MRRFVEGVDRSQTTLFSESLDDWIGENNPVRVIDAFVDALDLRALGFDGVVPEATGRPSYHPAVLLKLYIYGYLNRVQSSRRLEREAARNVELMWLSRADVADRPADAGSQDHRQLPQGQRPGHPAGLRPVRHPLPQAGPAEHGQRGH
jgi:transposase